MDLLANAIDGAPIGQLPCILDRQRLQRILRDHVRSASALRSALKKSLVANLSAKRQLSVAKLSAKRIFSLAKRDFLVANGRMAADFSSPASWCLVIQALNDPKEQWQPIAQTHIFTAWCSEIGSPSRHVLLATDLRATSDVSDVREPISLHLTVHQPVTWGCQ